MNSVCLFVAHESNDVLLPIEQPSYKRIHQNLADKQNDLTISSHTTKITSRFILFSSSSVNNSIYIVIFFLRMYIIIFLMSDCHIDNIRNGRINVVIV
jgi:hypothetical protein